MTPVAREHCSLIGSGKMAYHLTRNCTKRQAFG
jgi:hypothetical protein